MLLHKVAIHIILTGTRTWTSSAGRIHVQTRINGKKFREKWVGSRNIFKKLSTSAILELFRRADSIEIRNHYLRPFLIVMEYAIHLLLVSFYSKVNVMFRKKNMVYINGMSAMFGKTPHSSLRYKTRCLHELKYPFLVQAFRNIIVLR